MGKAGTPLFIACQNGHTNAIQALLRSDVLDVHKATNSGVPLLVIASHNGHTRAVRALLESDNFLHKVDADSATTDGATGLFVASAQGHVDTIRALLESGKVDANQANHVC